MHVELRPLLPEHAEAHNAGEDDLTVRWLTGAYGTLTSTLEAFGALAANAARGSGKRGFGVWVDGRLGGYVDCDPGNGDGLAPGDVNLSYAVHPWARGRGVATQSVALICDFVRGERIGERAALRIDPRNAASVRVAHRCGFTYVRDFRSQTDTDENGEFVTLSLYRLAL